MRSSDYPDQRQWWTVRFQIAWPDRQQPAPYTHVDLLLAHAVLSPILKGREQDITLWRFHRRWDPSDEDGHLFRLRFYAAPDAANSVCEDIDSSGLLKKLKSKGVVTDCRPEEAKEREYEVEDTSERSWPVEIRKSWPYFIMGASKMWLALVAECMDADPAQLQEANLEDMLSKYEQAGSRVAALWRSQGCHAFLHHLNAIFGYEPVLLNHSLVRF